MKMHAWLGVLAMLCVAGCVPEAAKVEAPGDVAPEPENRITLRIAHITGARLKAADKASARRLEEAVSLASAEQGLELVVFGGESIANDDAKEAAQDVETFAALAGVVAAKRAVVLGDRERQGALPREDVMRALERRKLVTERTGTWSDSPKAGVRLLGVDVARDGAVTPEASKATIEAIQAAKEPVLIVVADRPPLEPKLATLLRADARVKLVLSRGAEGKCEDPADAPATIATPDLDATAPVIRIIAIDGRDCTTKLLAVPGGAESAEQRLRLRPVPAKPKE